jgi:hypothetical protein
MFPEDRDIAPDVLNGLAVQVSELTLQRPRVFGDCRPGCRLGEELHWGQFRRRRRRGRTYSGQQVVIWLGHGSKENRMNSPQWGGALFLEELISPDSSEIENLHAQLRPIRMRFYETGHLASAAPTLPQRLPSAYPPRHYCLCILMWIRSTSGYIGST